MDEWMGECIIEADLGGDRWIKGGDKICGVVCVS